MTEAATIDSKDYRDFFARLTGVAAGPYPYQDRLARETILREKSVILKAPTGAGKTWAVVAPFLYSRALGRPIADRLIYALPLRSLAASLHEEVLQGLKRLGEPTLGAIQTQALDRRYPSKSIHCCLQMGGKANDPFLEGDLIFTTIDQVLSAYLLHPVSLSQRLDNLNAGALLGSYMVFDEIHLLEIRRALGTLVEMLDRLHARRRLCQFTLMTATMSDPGLDWLARKLGAQRFEIPENEVSALPSQRTKRRTYRWRARPLNAGDVAAEHRGGRTIVLSNSVTRAQEIFRELQRLYESIEDPPEILLLHSRFLSKDRESKEARLSALLGPTSTRANAILVATQVIEAGMDLSADHLHTDLAPVNAIIQRAGRTARYIHRNTGTVTIYDLPAEGGDRAALPYDATETATARAIFGALPEEGVAASHADESAWVEAAHRESEIKALGQFENLYQRRQSVHQSMDAKDRSGLSQLIRDADSLSVLVSSRPERFIWTGWDEQNQQRIGWPPLIGVPPGTVIGGLAKSFQRERDGQWVVRAAVPLDEETGRPGFDWVELSQVGEIKSQWLIAVHPDFARYDSHLGLVLGGPGREPDLAPDALPPLPRYQYRLERWRDHARRVAEQCRRMRPASTTAARLLAESFGIDSETLELWTELACVLHDVGKLNKTWQERAWNWQREKEKRTGFPECPRMPVAHTDYNPAFDREASAKPEFRLPPHAVEGAFAMAVSLGGALSSQFSSGEPAETFFRALVGALARHHAPRANQAVDWMMIEETDEEIESSLPQDCHSLKLHASDSSRSLITRLDREALSFTESRNERAWPLYCFLVRRLRLADQGSFESLV